MSSLSAPCISIIWGKNPSVSYCSIYIWNTQPYLSLANSFFSVRSFCLRCYLVLLHQRDLLFQPLHSVLHSSAFQQQEVLVQMQDLFYPHDFFFLPSAVPAIRSFHAIITPICIQFLLPLNVSTPLHSWFSSEQCLLFPQPTYIPLWSEFLHLSSTFLLLKTDVTDVYQFWRVGK